MDRSKPIIIGGVDITKSFTAEDILDMFKTGRLRQITDKGYCTQGTEDGTLQFVPYWESLAFRTETKTAKDYISYDFVDAMREDVEEQHPITRRTPQERVAAMMLRIAGEVKRSGRIGGLSDEQIASLAGESWKAGEPITGEAIRAASAQLLGVAEVDNREADKHRITRAHMTA